MACVSPFESSSRPVFLQRNLTKSLNKKRCSLSTLNYLKSNSLGSNLSIGLTLSNGTQNSPKRNSKSISTEVLKAPKPLLIPNEYNVLFSKCPNDKSVYQNLTDGQKHVKSFENCDLNQFRLDTKCCQNMKTSTPICTQPNKSHGNVFESALVGAPRLSLNLSFGSNENDGSVGSNFIQSPILMQFSKKNSIDDNLILLNNNQHNSCAMNTPPRPIFRCRICLDENDNQENLLSPCRCKGTVGLVHQECLEKWLLTSGKPSCELCGYSYIMVPSKKHHLINDSFKLNRFQNAYEKFKDWLNWRQTKRHLLADVVCLILLTPATYLGVYFCILGATAYSKINMFSWQTLGLWSLAIILIFLFLLWMSLAIRHHVTHFRLYNVIQRRINLEEEERLAALPPYKFSILPRVCGSSPYLHNKQVNEDNLINNINPLLNSSYLCNICSPSLYSNNNNSNNCDSNIHYSPSSNPELINIPTQKITVSVALTTVPEVGEEITTLKNAVSKTNIV